MIQKKLKLLNYRVICNDFSLTDKSVESSSVDYNIENMLNLECKNVPVD